MVVTAVGLTRGERSFLARTITEAVAGLLRESAPETDLAVYFESPDVRARLDGLGLSHLAEMPAQNLAQLVLEYAPQALDASRRCANCDMCVGVGDGEVHCEMGIWEKRTGRDWVTYSATTVKYNTQEIFRACDWFIRRNNGNDGAECND